MKVTIIFSVVIRDMHLPKVNLKTKTQTKGFHTEADGLSFCILVQVTRKEVKVHAFNAARNYNKGYNYFVGNDPYHASSKSGVGHQKLKQRATILWPFV